MSYVEKDIKLSDIEKEILWGISSIAQELRKNYDIIIRSNFDVDVEQYDLGGWDQDKLNYFVVSNNPEGNGWSNPEFEALLEEKVHMENLYGHLDSILNGGKGLDHQGVIDLIEEDRRAEKIEGMLEKKHENGYLEMGGKNTVKLTKALTEFSRCLKALEDKSMAETGSVSNQDWVEWVESLKGPRRIDGKNALYLLGGIQYKGDLSFDEGFYRESDYIVLDSLDFPFKRRGFEDFIKSQPQAGRFNYEEVIAENTFRDQLPVVIPDVLPLSEYRGIDLELIDKYASKIQGAAGIPGNTLVPAAAGAAMAGSLPYKPVMFGVITWQFVFKLGIPGVLVPRLLTGVAARMALFCEKLENSFAENVGGKPTFYMYTNKKEAALIAAFVKYPKLRRKVLKIHSMMDYGGLDKDYLNYMEEIKFYPGEPGEMKEDPKGGDKLPLEYEGRQTMVNYETREFETSIL